MKCFMTWQEKGDCLIEVTLWASLTVFQSFLVISIKYHIVESDVKHQKSNKINHVVISVILVPDK